MKRRTFMHSIAAGAIGLAGLPAFAGTVQRRSMTGIDADAKTIKLDDYAGKVCLVSFFTASCALCTHDLKLMREFYVGNRARDFVLIGVNLDASREDFMEYVRIIKLAVPEEQRFPMIWRNAPGHQDSFGAIKAQPTHFVLDKSHKIVLKREGTFQPNDWDDLWTSLA